MKRYLALLFTLFALMQLLTGQIIPTEIQYNPPEFGQDSLEYLEIYNNSDQDINLEGYSFTAGFTHTFSELDFPANSYIVLAVNERAFTTEFGFQPTAEWESGALNNSGEPIELRDNLGNVVFNVEYVDRDPWPGEADGNGPSLELCQLDADITLPSSWGPATTKTGVVIDGIEILGTPGQPNDPDCDLRFDHRIEVTNNIYTPADITITEGETILWENLEGNHNVDGRQSTYPDNPESFYSGAVAPAPWTFTHTFNEVGKYDYECTAHVALGMVGTVTVEPDEGEPTDFPPYDIGEVTGNNPEGVPDSLGVKCSLQGIIHGANKRENGYLFTFIDSLGDGIGTFRPNDIGPYRPEQGDEIIVEGTIGQFNGLTQIEVENIMLLSRGNDIQMPIEINNPLSEETESQYIGIGPGTFVDSDQWDDSGNSFNFEFEDADGNRFDIRIDRNTELAGLAEPPLPNGFDDVFTIIGVGGQFDNSLPFEEGYQMLPSFEGDFMVSTSATSIQKSDVLIFPNPTDNQLIIRNIPAGTKTIKIYNEMGILVKEIPNPETQINTSVSNLTAGPYIIHFYGHQINESTTFVIK